jgi:hypothetical protein
MIKLVSSQGCRDGSTQQINVIQVMNRSKDGSTSPSTNVIQLMNRSKDKKHKTISKDTEKAFTSFLIKALMKIGIERLYLNIIKAIYDKLTANIIHNEEKLKPFPLKSRMRQGCPLSTLIQHSFGIPSHSNNRNKRNSNRKEVKLSLFTEDMILDLKDLKNSIKKKNPRHYK